MIRNLIIFLSIFFLIGCGGSTLDRKDSTQYDKGSFNQLGKLDFDRMADYEIRENFESLKVLMIKLYKRNPMQLKKRLPIMLNKQLIIFSLTPSINGILNPLEKNKAFRLFISLLMKILKATECYLSLLAYTR